MACGTFRQLMLSSFTMLTRVRLITNVDEVTRSRIVAMVRNGITDGTSYTTLDEGTDKAVSRVGGVQTSETHIRNRARLIAVTEMGEAWEGGRMRQAGSRRTGWNPFQKKVEHGR